MSKGLRFFCLIGLSVAIIGFIIRIIGKIDDLPKIFGLLVDDLWILFLITFIAVGILKSKKSKSEDEQKQN